MEGGINSPVLENQVPHSSSAEQSVLGCLLIDPSCLTSIQSKGFRPDFFYNPQNRAIYESIVRIDDDGDRSDVTLVLEHLKKNNVFDEAAGKQYLLQLLDLTPSTANIDSYVKILKDRYYKRNLLDVTKEIQNMVASEEANATELIDNAEQSLYNIRHGKSSNSPSSFSDLAPSVFDELWKMNDPETRDQYLGFSTGFSQLDHMISGLNKSDLIIVGARPAMGKTSFALNLFRNAAVKEHKKCLFFSLEMTKEQLVQRIISTEARVKGNKMRNGTLSESDWRNIKMAMEGLMQSDMYFDDTSNITVNEMKAKIRRMKDVDCVFIDYLQLMKSATRTDSRVQEVSEITRSLKLMAKDLNVPVIVLAQLSRGTEGRGKSHKPQLSDLRESGSIEQDADIVLMLYREDYYNGEEDENPDLEKEVDKVEVIVGKNRHGPTGIVEMAWDGEFTLFSTIERNRDEFV